MLKVLPISDLCEGIPEEFLLYMKYCRILRFRQLPDYTIYYETYS